MGARALTWLDVFTSTPLSGNQLAVVHDADGLDDATMLAFARETRLSETTFVQTATEDGADYRNRIFMTRGELPFAGHPSLGTAVAVARARGEREATYVQQTPAGLQPIEVELGEDGAARASMLQEPLTLGPVLDPAAVLAVAGLAAEDAVPQLGARIVSTGGPQVLAFVRPDALGGAVADHASLVDLLDAHDAITLYLVAWDRGQGTARARAFYPDPGAASEDPATGSAAGPLCAYLHTHAGVDALTVAQGIEMGRPSRLDCRMEGDRVRVGGEAVIVASGTVSL